MQLNRERGGGGLYGGEEEKEEQKHVNCEGEVKKHCSYNYGHLKSLNKQTLLHSDKKWDLEFYIELILSYRIKIWTFSKQTLKKPEIAEI